MNNSPPARRATEDAENVRIIERGATQWTKQPRPWGFWLVDTGRAIRVTEESVQPVSLINP
jgi:hypothetical protein